MPAQTKSTLKLTYGSTVKYFDLAGPVLVRQQTLAGSLIRQVSAPDRDAFVGAPWHISDITGIGMMKADSDLGGIGASKDDADLRAWEMKLIDRWPGMWCLGPAAQAVTDMSGTRRVIGFASLASNLFYFGNNATAAAENVAYWVGSTDTWTNATLTADWETQGAGYSGFPVSLAGMAFFKGSYYALRPTAADDDSTGNEVRQLAASTDRTTWTFPAHSAAGSYAATPSGSATLSAYGLITGVTPGFLHTVIADTGNTRHSFRSSQDGVTWSSAAGAFGVDPAQFTPQGITVWVDGSGLPAAVVTFKNGVWMGTDSDANGSLSVPVQIVDFSGDVQDNNGVSPIVWPIHEEDHVASSSCLIVPQGDHLWAFHWVGNGTTAQLIAEDVMHGLYHGLPGPRHGNILAIASVGAFIFVSIGGEDSSHKGGMYRVTRAAGKWHVWGPIYVNEISGTETANLRVRAMGASSNDDSTKRLHFSIDTTAGGAVTTQKFFENLDVDPRTVTYLHTGQTGSLILPKNDRDLPGFTGTWRKIVVTGSGLDATEKVTAVYASKDAAPLDASGSWGTTLGAITASGGSVNFAATPTGTGESAVAQQLRLDLVGASNASPYIEAISVFVKKAVTAKYYYEFQIDLRPPASARSAQGTITDLKTILSQTVDIQASWEKQADVVMEPYLSTQGTSPTPALDYVYAPEAAGVKSTMLPIRAVLRLAEV